MLNERSLLSQFLHFVAATVASLMVFSLYSIVDGLMVSKGVNEYAMASVNLAVPFTNVLFSIGIIFAVGTSTIIAIYLGQGQGEKANSLFSQNTVLLACIGLTITVLVLVFLEPFAVLLGAKDVTYQYTIDYLKGLAPFAVCFIVSYNMEVLIKTDGYPKLAILTVITGCLTNCVLDYVAIFLLDWGVWGAAVATGLSQLLTCVIYLRHFLRGHNTFHFVKFKMDWSIYKRAMRDTTQTTANIMVLVMAATCFSWLLTVNNIPTLLSNCLLSIVHTKLAFWAGVLVLLVLLGMFMDVSTIILIIAPLLAPVAYSFGIDPIQFGCVFVFTLAIGQATPPFGACLFVSSSMSGHGIMRLGVLAIPFVIALLSVIVLTCIFPPLATLLPSFMSA